MAPRRRDAAQRQPAQDGRGGSTGASPKGGGSKPPPARLSGPVYLMRQYAGLVLGLAAMYCTVAFYRQGDASMPLKMLGWVALAGLGAVLHEFRPYKRMNYGDVARMQGRGAGRFVSG